MIDPLSLTSPALDEQAAQVFSAIAGDSAIPETPEPEQPPAEAAPAAQPAPEMEALNRTVAELQEKLNTATERLEATQTYASQNANARILAQALVDAQAQQRVTWERERQAAQQMRPPTLSPEEKEALLTDPDLAWRKIGEAVQYGIGATLARVQPHLERADFIHSVSGPLIQNQQQDAYFKARELVESMPNGMTPDEFDQLYERTYDVLQEAARQANDPMQYTLMSLQPQAIATAAGLARQQMTGGPRVKPTAPPKTAGTGDRNPAPRRTPERPELIGRFERASGKKVDDESVARFNEARRKFNEVL